MFFESIITNKEDCRSWAKSNCGIFERNEQNARTNGNSILTFDKIRAILRHY